MKRTALTSFGLFVLVAALVVAQGCARVGIIDDNGIVDGDGSDGAGVPGRDNYVLTYWGPFIDAINEGPWQDYIGHARQLRDIGATHAGIHILRINPTLNQRDITASRIRQLRSDGFDIALNQSSGHRILIKDNELDPNTHETNGHNLKYFDSVGFDPIKCAARFPCPDSPSRHAHDPAYDGVVWQKELNFLADLLARAKIGADDLVLFDIEVWGGKISYLHSVYPGVLENSVQRYSGTLVEREEQYFGYWSQRGKDVRDLVKQNDRGTGVYFYNENIPELERERTKMPGGVGDAPSPDYYYAPNLSRFQEELDKGDFSGTSPWVSFSTVYKQHIELAGSGPVDMRWDPRITQKAGYLLKQEGVTNVLIYPGPGQDGVPVDYYMEHAQALVDGWLDGIDPGELVEICGDGWDNDGDGEWDEGCR